jgi:hypothetical protein
MYILISQVKREAKTFEIVEEHLIFEGECFNLNTSVLKYDRYKLI